MTGNKQEHRARRLRSVGAVLLCCRCLPLCSLTTPVVAAVAAVARAHTYGRADPHLHTHTHANQSILCFLVLFDAARECAHACAQRKAAVRAPPSLTPRRTRA
eukprot:979935-Rhodomonas_salina.3